MATGAVLAAALTDHSAWGYSLTINGLDVTKQPGGSGFGVPPETIEVTEAGPGGVSSIDFKIDDPFKSITIPDGAEIQFWKLTTNVCLFRGYVDQYSAMPDFGGQGRTWAVQGIGVEAILDWTIVPAQGGPFDSSNPHFPGAVGLLATVGAPQLKAPMKFFGAPGAPFTANGSFDYPIGTMENLGASSYPLPITSPSGPTITGTLRQAIEAYANICYRSFVSGARISVPYFLTVDFYLGIRLWEDLITAQPDDYTTLTVTDTYAGTNVAENLRFEAEPGSTYHNAYVVGTGVAAFFGDGTGTYGRTALIQDTAITDNSMALYRAATFMDTQAIPARGTFELTDWTPPSTVHAGSLVSITDAATGLATNYRIMEIHKTWNNSGRENWTVSFGGLRRSAMRKVRNFTRTVKTYGVTGAA